MRRSEMTEEQRLMMQEKKKNVQLMNVLRNLENQITSKFSNVIKLKRLNNEYATLQEET